MAWDCLPKTKKELETLIQTVRIYSDEIGMEFDVEKCAMLIMKSGKRQMAEGLEQLSQGKSRTLGEQENYKYLGLFEANTIKSKKKNTPGERENY